MFPAPKGGVMDKERYNKMFTKGISSALIEKLIADNSMTMKMSKRNGDIELSASFFIVPSNEVDDFISFVKSDER